MLTKRFFKNGTCKVTFELPKAIKASSVSVAGDFNNWDPMADRMKKVKGTWRVTVDLKINNEYQFRYLINGNEWHNDWDADKYIPNNVDGDNSVVNTFSVDTEE